MTGHPSVRGWFAALVLAAALLALPIPDVVVERYFSRGAYPWIQAMVTTVTNQLPIAAADILISTVLLFVLVRLILLVRTWREQGAATALWEGTRRLVRAASVAAIVFAVFWGLNYRRIPLAQSLAPPPPPSVDVLVEVIAEANARAARLRGSIGEPHPTYEELAEMLRGPMRQVLGDLGRSTMFTPGRPRSSVVLTPYFSRAGITGMLDPFALESIVHPDLVPAERAFVLAHEWAHLAGQADEAEASAIGWFACMRAGGAAAYSASLYLILEAAGDLPRQARDRAYANLDDGVRADLVAIGERIRAQQNPQVQRAAFRVYNEYLRANRVEDGTASYGRALSLILSPSIRGAVTPG